MDTNNKDFTFLKSGDDLASYNIAQKCIDLLSGKESSMPVTHPQSNPSSKLSTQIVHSKNVNPAPTFKP